MKLIYGKGINDCGMKDSKKEYNTWRHMIQRCYSEKYQVNRPTYKGCSVCDEWLYFSNFKKWYKENYRFDLDEMGIKLELDKDLLSKENKIYSPETCIFIPQKVNSFLSNKKSTNNTGYIGVGFHKATKKYRTRIYDFYTYERRDLGLFDTPEEARNVYIKERKIECEKVKKWLLELGYDKSVADKVR